MCEQVYPHPPQRPLCAAWGVAHVGALTSSGSLRYSVPTSSPRRSRFLRSALTPLQAHTNTHISGSKQSEGTERTL